MHTQMNQSNAIIRRLPTVIFLLFTIFFGATAIAADSLLYIGNLPVSETNAYSEYLTLNQHGTLLENDQVSLKWQDDGNLVLYYYNQIVLWASNTSNKGSLLTFQKSDGKLSIKNATGDVIWSSTGTDAYQLKLTWDHNLVISNSSNSQIWESGSARPGLVNDGTIHSINFANAVEEYQVPLNPQYKYLHLSADGADGGKKRVEETWGDVRFQVAGGSGATISAIFEIGNGNNMIPPGSTIRVVVGEKGGTRIGQTSSGCEGGGGTGIMFRRPLDDYWHLLLVAGGGGGAYSDCCSVKREGRSAETGEDGGIGGGDKYSGGKAGDCGKGGGGGLGYFGGWGGCGVNNDGWSNKKILNGTNDYVVTGLPSNGYGERAIGAPITFGLGSGDSETPAGGGGGGYSGGGCGKDTYPGGGGGSFINTYMAVDEFRRKNDPTTETGNGFITYRFTNSPDLYHVIRMSKNTGKCFDDAGGGTDVGTNIQVWDCNGQNSQSWYFDGFAIKLKKDPGKCVDLDYSRTNNGTNIQLWTCSSTHGQRWIYDGISKNIRSGVDQSKCIDVVNGFTANSTNIQLWDCAYNDAQKWTIEGATNPTISNNYDRIHLSLDPQKCLDLEKASPVNGGNIQVYHCHYAASQYWNFDGNTIRYNADQSKCLDLSNSKTGNGTNIQLYECNGTAAQKWTYNGITKSFHSWLDPAKCIDVDDSGTADNTNIQIWDCNGTAAQQFVIGN